MCILTAGEAHSRSKRWDQQLGNLSSFVQSLGGYASDLQAVRDLLKEIEVFRLDHPIDSEGQPLPIDVCEELAELGFRVESTITEKMGIKFENRDEQIDLLVSDEDHNRDGLSSFWLLDAPARYGKTFFIFEVRKRLQAKDWKVCYFSFKDYLGTAQDQTAFLRAFRRTFDKSFVEPWPNPTIDQLRERLAADLGNKSSQLAIFIDAAELVTEKAMVTWLTEFLAGIKRKHKATGKRFIGLVSGRYISPNWYDVSQVAPLTFDKIPMGSLGYRFTLNMIDGISSRFKISNPGENMEAKEATARIVQMIGAGCPECTINLLIDIGRDAAFNPSQDYFSEERRQLFFRLHAEPVCNQVLEDIQEPFTRKYFPYLCILRRHNRYLLKDLMVFIQTKLFHEAAGEASPELVEEILNRSGLIAYDINRAFQGDDNIRQLFGLQKWLFENKAAQKINQWAMLYFKKQITQKKRHNDSGIAYNREAFIEFIYHSVLKLSSLPLTKEQASQSFAGTLLEAYRKLEEFSKRQEIDEYEWKSHKTFLVKAITRDVEIRAQMAHFGVSETEYAQLCNLP
jgi:hypothetical protein